MHEEVTIPELTEVVGRLAALLGPREGGVAILEGGITNRNFRVNFGGTAYVVRLPGKNTDLLGIDREAEQMATRRASELELGPKVAAMLTEPSCLVTCFIASREMTGEELRSDSSLTWIASGLRRFHGSGLELPTSFRVLDIANRYAEISRARGKEPPPEFSGALESAERIVKAVREHPEHTPVPCHNDLLAANFLFDGSDIALVDWEYAGMGDRFFDLGNFSVNNELEDGHEARLLESYFGEPATGRRTAALQLFRFMSDFREAMWGVVQSSVSDLDFDFDGYASKHFTRLTETRADERFDTWLEEARQ